VPSLILLFLTFFDLIGPRWLLFVPFLPILKHHAVLQGRKYVHQDDQLVFACANGIRAGTCEELEGAEDE
jgi:hypothetical protein